MNYISIARLSEVIRNNLGLVPKDVDLVVGIPRSGMLAANIVALNLNIKICDISGFISDTPLMHGQTRLPKHQQITKPSQAKHVLIIDDSIASGISIAHVKAEIESKSQNQKLTFAACFATECSKNKVDLYFEILKHPRLFEWNIMHRPFLDHCCIDIDGVLCVDPTNEQNDDGEKYRDFLLNATPLVIPSYPLGVLVTSRLEKYREETEAWLQRNAVVYQRLHMLDLSDAETRRRLGCHAKFKAEIFRKESSTLLFIESDSNQARVIAEISGKHCLCFGTQELFDPSFSYAYVHTKAKKFTKQLVGKSIRMIRRNVTRDKS